MASMDKKICVNHYIFFFKFKHVSEMKPIVIMFIEEVFIITFFPVI